VRRVIEKLMFAPLVAFVAIFVIAACEVDRSHVTEVTVPPDTTIVCDEAYDTIWTEIVDTLPPYQDTLPAVQDTLPAYQDTLPAFQDTLPPVQDTTFVNVEVVDTLQFLLGLCERRGNSNNWACTWPN
jgi:hypothetical protein